jgi:transcriptional regulator with XRE-family HTH domain
MSLKKQIGEEIRKRRLELSLGQLDLLDYTEISSKTLSNLEQGKGNITLDTLEKIINILGMEYQLKIQNKVEDARG